MDSLSVTNLPQQ